MIFIFVNVWLFDNIFNLYEFHEKQNIEYQLGPRAKSEDFHDDLRGSQGRNIEYYQGPRATVDVFHVTLGVRKLKHLMGGAGSPILSLDPSARQIGYFRDLKVSMILKASFQNWVPSRILVAGSMCQIIPVRLINVCIIQDWCCSHTPNGRVGGLFSVFVLLFLLLLLSLLL